VTAPCETCKGTMIEPNANGSIDIWPTGKPCPDCQPKPEPVSDERIRELRDTHMVKVRHLPRPTLEELTKLLSSTDDVSVQILPTGEVLATTCPDSTTFVAICNELLTARATIERQAGEIDDITRKRDQADDLRRQLQAENVRLFGERIERDKRISQLEAALASRGYTLGVIRHAVCGECAPMIIPMCDAAMGDGK
jgi:hypothetical protein